MRTLSITLALALAASGLTPAAAGDAEQRTVGVGHADLDLATAQGRDELERRIDRAAQAACGIGEAQVGTRLRTREQRDCYRQARREFDRHFAAIIAAEQLGAERGG